MKTQLRLCACQLSFSSRGVNTVNIEHSAHQHACYSSGEEIPQFSFSMRFDSSYTAFRMAVTAYFDLYIFSSLFKVLFIMYCDIKNEMC